MGLVRVVLGLALTPLPHLKFRELATQLAVGDLDDEAPCLPLQLNDMRDSKGLTLLALAAKEGHVDVVALLGSIGVTLRGRTADTPTACVGTPQTLHMCMFARWLHTT